MKFEITHGAASRIFVSIRYIRISPPTMQTIFDSHRAGPVPATASQPRNAASNERNSSSTFSDPSTVCAISSRNNAR